MIRLHPPLLNLETGNHSSVPNTRNSASMVSNIDIFICAMSKSPSPSNAAMSCSQGHLLAIRGLAPTQRTIYAQNQPPTYPSRQGAEVHRPAVRNYGVWAS